MPRGLVVLQFLLPYHIALLPATGLLLIIALAEPGTRRLLLRRTPLDLPVAMLLVAFAVSTFSASGDHLAAAQTDLHLVGGVALFFLTANTVTTLLELRSIAWALICVGGLTAIGGVFERLDPPKAAALFGALGGSAHFFPGHHLVRATAAVSHPNVLAHVLGVSILLLGGVILIPVSDGVAGSDETGGRRLRRQLGVPALVLLLCLLTETLVLTYSRGGVLAVLGGLIVLVCLTFAGRATGSQWRPAVALASTVAILLAGSLAWDPTFAHRIASLTHADYGPNHERMILWRGAVLIASRHLLTGVGPENFEAAWTSREVATDPSLQTADDIPGYHAHNLFLQLAACVGILGVGAMAWLALATLVLGTRLVRRCANLRLGRLAAGCTGAIAAVFLHGLVDYFWHAPAALMVFWLLPGMLVAANRLAQGSGPPAVSVGSPG